MTIRRSLLLSLSIPCVLMVSSARGYEVETHQEISRAAAKQSAVDQVLKQSLGFPQGLATLVGDKDATDWIALGATREDGFARFLNHFHNPLAHWGVAGFFLSQSSVLWGQNPSQQWSWSRTRDYYREALTNPAKTQRDDALTRTFRGLGQLIHLIQDAAVPAHTRNDPHYGWNYEKFVRAVEFNAADENEMRFVEDLLNNPWRPNPAWRSSAPNPLAPIPVARLIDNDQYASTDDFTGTNPGITTSSDIGVAEYTNANFFSEDSTWESGTALRPFRYPARSSVVEVTSDVPLRTGEVVKRQYYRKAYDGDTGYRLATVGFLRDYFVRYNLSLARANEKAALDELVYRDYVERLLPRAVGYSAALLDYFFRGDFETRVTDVRLDGTGLRATVHLTNRTPGEAMAGTFALYYDAANGERVSLVSWPLVLSAGAETDLPPIPPPRQDKPPVDPGRYLAVFRGTLGGEADAVAARWINVSAGYARALWLSQSCTRQASNQLLCQDTLGASGRAVMPQPDATVEFGGDDTFTAHSLSRTIGPPLYPNDGPTLYVNAEQDMFQSLYLYREGDDPVLQLTVQASGASYSPCYLDWGPLSGPPQALATSTFYDRPALAQWLGGVYLPASGTYTLQVSPEPLLFRFFNGTAILPPFTGAGTFSGAARCDFTSIRFTPE